MARRIGSIPSPDNPEVQIRRPRRSPMPNHGFWLFVDRLLFDYRNLLHKWAFTRQIGNAIGDLEQTIISLFFLAAGVLAAFNALLFGASYQIIMAFISFLKWWGGYGLLAAAAYGLIKLLYFYLVRFVCNFWCLMVIVTRRFWWVPVGILFLGFCSFR